MLLQTSPLGQIVPVLAALVGGAIGVVGSLGSVWYRRKHERKQDEIQWYSEFRRIAREIIYTRELNEAAIREFNPDREFGGELQQQLSEIDEPRGTSKHSVFAAAEITDVDELNEKLSTWQGEATQNLSREMEFHYEQFRSHAASYPGEIPDELGDAAGKLLAAMYRDMIIQGIPLDQEVTSDVQEHATNVVEECNSKIEELESESVLRH